MNIERGWASWGQCEIRNKEQHYVWGRYAHTQTDKGIHDDSCGGTSRKTGWPWIFEERNESLSIQNKYPIIISFL